MIVVYTTEYPKKEIVATCRTCGKEVKRKAWDTYAEYKRLSFSMKKSYTQCPHCEQAAGTEALKWEKHYDIYGGITQDWEAKTADGDFLIWRDGKVWKARYRAFGSDIPKMLGVSRTRDGAKRLCERSRFNSANKKIKTYQEG